MGRRLAVLLGLLVGCDEGGGDGGGFETTTTPSTKGSGGFSSDLVKEMGSGSGGATVSMKSGDGSDAKVGDPKAGSADPNAGDAKAGSGDPKAGDPKAGDAKASSGDPKAGDPKAGDPKAGDPKAGDPKAVTGDPKAGDPKAGDPKAGDPKAGDPKVAVKAGDPKAGDPKAGDPKAGDPKATDPKVAVKDPKAGDPKAGDAKAVDPKAGSGTKTAGGPPAINTAAPRVYVKPSADIGAIKLSLLPNWDRDVGEAGTISLVVKVPGGDQTRVFAFRYGYEDPKAPSDREAYKKWLAEQRILMPPPGGALVDRQRGGSWYLEGVDGAGAPVFRNVVVFGGRKLICGGSLYKDATSNQLGDIRDKTIIQAKEICGDLGL
jgi:hypothetical protein